VTPEGAQLATEVRTSGCTASTQTSLIREIIAYEGSHGALTHTFVKKIRRQIRTAASR
jgi:hypothetical protein